MNNKLKLNNLLQLSKEEISNAKIKLNVWNGVHNPIDEYKNNPDELLRWNYWNNQPYKEGQISIGLVRMDRSSDEWLLFTVGKILKITNKDPNFDGVNCKYETYKKYKDLYGRVVLYYHNTAQNMFRNADGLIDLLEIKEILPSKYTGFDFPGYEKVCLKFKELESIVLKNDSPSYKNALKNQKAVYLITDMENGKLYVGSAYGEEMLLQRWTSYVLNGHGGNKELKQIIKEKGFDYVKENFQYTILENYNYKMDDKYILEREKYWKNALCSSHEYGNYNWN